MTQDGVRDVSRFLGPVLTLFLLIPFIPKVIYGDIGAGYYLSQRQWRDFMFLAMALASLAAFIRPIELKMLWLVVLGAHLITKQAFWMGWATTYLLSFGFGLVLFTILSERMSLWHIKAFLNGFLILAFVNLMAQLLQLLGLDPFHHVKEGYSGVTAVGFLGHSTACSVYYALAIPAAWRMRKWLIIPLLIGILITGSRIGVISAITALIILNWRVGVVAGILLMVSALTLFGSVVPVSSIISAISIRLDIFMASLSAWAHPILGDGFGAWYHYRFIAHNEWFAQAHNEYWQFIYELGFISLIPVGLLLIRVKRTLSGIRETLPAVLLAGVAVLAVSSITYFPFHMTPLAVIGLFYMAGFINSMGGWR
jgi:hypothetical protein